MGDLRGLVSVGGRQSLGSMHLKVRSNFEILDGGGGLSFYSYLCM